MLHVRCRPSGARPVVLSTLRRLFSPCPPSYWAVAAPRSYARYDALCVRKTRQVSPVKEKEPSPAKEQEEPRHRGQVESIATPPGRAGHRLHTRNAAAPSG